MRRLILWVSLLILVSVGAAGDGDVPPTKQTSGEHSTITVQAPSATGSLWTYDTVRDDDLAEMIGKAIDKAGKRPLSVLVFFNSCFGGGMLDDIAAMLGEFEPAIPFVGGSASSKDLPCWGPNDAKVGGTDMGSYWTDSLLDAIRDATVGERVVDTLAKANADDRAAETGDVGQRHINDGDDPDTPQNTSAHGGYASVWGSSAQVVVFSGNNTDKDHKNNESKMTQVLSNRFGKAAVRSSSDTGNWGRLRADLERMIDSAVAALNEGDHLILYVDDHGGSEIDVLEREIERQTEFEIPQEQPDNIYEVILHPGWAFALDGNLDQGDQPMPYISVAFSDGDGDLLSRPLPELYSFQVQGVYLTAPEAVAVPGEETRIYVPAVLLTSWGDDTRRITLRIAPLADCGFSIADVTITALRIGTGSVNNLKDD